MSKLFYKKSTAIIVIAAILVLVLLVCMLLVFLTQMTNVRQRAAELHRLVESNEKTKEELLQDAEYKKSIEYVKKWAEEHGRVNGSDITWVTDNL